MTTPAEDAGPNDLAARWGGLLLLAWALLTPLTVPLPGPGGVRLAISDFLGLATIAFLPIAAGRGHLARTVPIAAIIAWALTTTMVNLEAFPSAVQAVFRVMRMAFILSPMALALLIGDTVPARARGRIIDAYLAATLGGMVIGLAMNQLGITMVQAQTYDFGRGQVARATGLMGDSSAFGHLGAAGVAVVLCLLATQRRLRVTTAVLCAALLAVLPVYFFASLSRALLVDLIVVVIALAGLAIFGAYDRGRVLGRIGGAVAVAVVSIGGMSAAFPVEARTVLARLDLDSITEFGGDPAALIARMGSGRSNVWGDSIALAQSNPVFGLGYKGLITRYLIPGDNVLLSAFADLGVIGGLAVAGLLLLALGLTLRAVFADGDDVCAKIAAPLWIGTIAHMMLVDVTTYYSSFPVVLLIVALAITARRREAPRQLQDWRYVPGRQG